MRFGLPVFFLSSSRARARSLSRIVASLAENLAVIFSRLQLDSKFYQELDRSLNPRQCHHKVVVKGKCANDLLN